MSSAIIVPTPGLRVCAVPPRMDQKVQGQLVARWTLVLCPTMEYGTNDALWFVARTWDIHRDLFWGALREALSVKA